MIEPERVAQRQPAQAPVAAVIGGGPAGLIAAQTLREAGAEVTLFDAMASVGRKFLLAGKGGLNLSHSEPMDRFVPRYREASPHVGAWLRRFGPDAVRELAQDLGFSTFVGSSGRVFPSDMKAGPMLRTWLRRLRESGIEFKMRHRFTGWQGDGCLRFECPDGALAIRPDITILSLGGGSWPKLGSDGAWFAALASRGVSLMALKPANCGFECDWSEVFSGRFAGEPLKSVAARLQGDGGWRHGEMVITRHGIEGSLVYALSAPLRDRIERDGQAVLELDLMPKRQRTDIEAALAMPRAARSRSEHWRRRLGLSGVGAGLVHEVVPRPNWDDPVRLATAVKALPLRVLRTRPIDEAISTAGGVRLDAVDERLMLRGLPGVFAAGEMLDWEAPTGGYLLTACLASGVIAAEGALAWRQEHHRAL
ncbi:MAG TPA: TIGR03862 family flavoprotein [Chiayiivirga sp.]|nr:TIGR03862 family flavoprotein [Chiayiivirga sp.]